MMASPGDFYSQNFEDVLLARVFADTAVGTYVDVGCHHEMEYSVTRYFYERGWSGINIDPVSEHIAEHACRTRDISINCAAGAQAARMKFTVVANSGLSSFYESHLQHAYTHGLDQQEERWVDINTLDSILDQYFSPDRVIHFLKIDVEGDELNVLKGIDLHRYRPIVILAETTLPNTTSLVDDFEAISSLICSHGYRQVYFDGINTWWLSEEECQQRLPLFSYPVGVFDGFVPYNIRLAYRERSEVRLTADPDPLTRIQRLRRFLRGMTQA